MLISISGIVFVAWGDFGHADLMMLVGDGLSLLCIIALVGYMFLGQRVVSKISFWTYSFLVFLIAGIMLNLFNLVTETPIMHYGSHDWLVFFGCWRFSPRWLTSFTTRCCGKSTQRLFL